MKKPGTEEAGRSSSVLGPGPLSRLDSGGGGPAVGDTRVGRLGGCQARRSAIQQLPGWEFESFHRSVHPEALTSSLCPSLKGPNYASLSREDGTHLMCQIFTTIAKLFWWLCFHVRTRRFPLLVRIAKFLLSPEVSGRFREASGMSGCADAGAGLAVRALVSTLSRAECLRRVKLP